MTRRECLLTLLCTIFFSFLVVLLCFGWQHKKNEELMLQKIERKILLIEEKNDAQDNLINGVANTQRIIFELN